MTNYIEIKRQDNGLFNFLKPDGTLVSKEWFRYTWAYCEGFIRVQREDDRFNFLKSDGTFLSEEWFEQARNFCEGFAKVQRKDFSFILILVH